MTAEEKESLALIIYRLGVIESSQAEMKEDTKQIGQILGKLRLDEQVLSELRHQVNKLEHNQTVTDRKQDGRLESIEGILMPKHEYWTSTADTQRGLLVKVAVAVITAVGSMGGLVTWMT